MPCLAISAALLFAVIEAFSSLWATLFGPPRSGSSLAALWARSLKSPAIVAGPLTPHERRQLETVLTRFVDGQPFTYDGLTLERAAVARGALLATGTEHVLRIETLHFETHFQEHDDIEHRIYGFHDERGRLHRFASESSQCLNTVTGNEGDALVIIYERGSLRHLVFNTSRSHAPVRNALRRGAELPED